MRMCDVCIRVLGRRAKPHADKQCAIAKSMFCTLCSVYGHSYKACPQTALKDFRESSEIIIAEEPIPIYFPPGSESWVEVTDDDEGVCVRAMLIANNIVPMACQEKGRREGRDVRENRARLVEFMKRQKKTLIFIKPIYPKATTGAGLNTFLCLYLENVCLESNKSTIRIGGI